MNRPVNRESLIPLMSSVKWQGFVKILVVLGLFAGLLVAFLDWAYDDPFITYRYARNLAAGAGFVYNPGQKTLSTTTPLFTILLALGSLLWSDIPKLAVLIGIAALLWGGIFFLSLAESWKCPWVGWIGFLLFPTFPLVVSTLGSETPLYLALCLGTYVFYLKEQFVPAAGMAALASLTRPDGILVPLILGIDYLVRGERRFPWKSILIFLGISVPWLIFAWVYFGSPVPATLATKQHQGLMEISEPFSRGIITILSSYRAWPYYLAAFCGIGGLIYAFLRRREILILLIWPVVYFMAYSFLNVSRYFWYYAPLVPGFVVAVGAGLSATAETVSRIDENKVFRRWIIYLPHGLLLTFLLSQVSDLSIMARNPDQRYAAYRSAGEWLAENTTPDVKVGVLEVGMMGFFADRTMIDFAGLLQPEVAQVLGPQTTYQDSAIWAIGEYRPEYIVLHKGLFPDLESELGRKGCELENMIKGSDFQYQGDLIIFHCSG